MQSGHQLAVAAFVAFVAATLSGGAGVAMARRCRGSAKDNDYQRRLCGVQTRSGDLGYL